MANRIKANYNYRIKSSSTKKKEVLKPSRRIRIRNPKKKVNKVVEVPVTEKDNSIQPKTKIRNKIRNNRSKIKSNIKKIVHQVTLEDLQKYCRDKTLLLVGNAKDIIENEYGEQIDSYDIVVRMNHGHPLTKYKKNMGEKCDIWFHGFLSKKRQTREYAKIKNGIDFHIEADRRKLCNEIFDEKAFLIDARWYKRDHEKRQAGRKRQEMSTGLNAIAFFIQKIATIKTITIVGFDFLRSKNSKLGSKMSRCHNPDIEESYALAQFSSSGKYVPFNEKYDFFAKK